MDERLKREMFWALGCFFGALAFLYALGFVARADVPAYALVTGAALIAILVDGYRFYQENAEVDNDVRTTGLWRPARLIPARERPRRQHNEAQGN